MEMVAGYIDILTKCDKCGEDYARTQSKQCPHIVACMVCGEPQYANRLCQKHYEQLYGRIKNEN